jgi:polysaccharide biosynthesis transport protein
MKNSNLVAIDSSPHSSANLQPMLQPPPFPEESKGDWNAKRVLGVLKRRWHIVSGIAILVASYMIGGSLSTTSEYQGRFRLLVEPVNGSGDVSKLVSGIDPATSTLDYETQVQVLQGPELIREVTDTLRSEYPNLDYKSIVSNLKINRLGKTKILEVRFEGTNAERVEAILKQLAKTYLEYSLGRRETYLRQGLQFVEQQLPVNQRQVDQLQQQLQTFRQNNYFYDPNAQAQQMTGQINAIDQQRASIDQAMTVAAADLALLQNENALVTTLNQSSDYQGLIGQLRSIEVQIAQELTRFGPQSLNIRVLQEKRDNLLPFVQQAAQQAVGGKAATLITQMQALQIQRDAIDQAQDQLYRSFQQLPVLSRQFADLQRDLQIATENLNRVLSSRETLKIQASQSEIAWQIVEPPSVTVIAARDQRQNVLMAIAIGVAAGLATAVLLEQLANNYATVEELKKKVRLPILGQIPFHSKLRHPQGSRNVKQAILSRISNVIPSPVAPDSDPSSEPTSVPNSLYGTSAFVESLRILYTNLQTRSLDQPIHSIIVSSAEPGDGKTTIAVQLAQTVAAMGKRVLLIDADLRRPSVHTQLQLQNHQGLFEVITANLPLQEAFQHPAHLPLCKVLPAGHFPSDPTQILASQRMQECMNKFHQIADLVIYDAPPLGGLADASILAPHTDGILFVVGLGKTNQSVLTETLENLQISQVPILGIVCNSLSA